MGKLFIDGFEVVCHCREYQCAKESKRYQECDRAKELDKMMSKLELRKEIEKLEQERPRTLNEFNAREFKLRNLLEQLSERTGSDKNGFD